MAARDGLVVGGVISRDPHQCSTFTGFVRFDSSYSARHFKWTGPQPEPVGISGPRPNYPSSSCLIHCRRRLQWPTCLVVGPMFELSQRVSHDRVVFGGRVAFSAASSVASTIETIHACHQLISAFGAPHPC